MSTVSEITGSTVLPPSQETLEEGTRFADQSISANLPPLDSDLQNILASVAVARDSDEVLDILDRVCEESPRLQKIEGGYRERYIFDNRYEIEVGERDNVGERTYRWKSMELLGVSSCPKVLEKVERAEADFVVAVVEYPGCPGTEPQDLLFAGRRFSDAALAVFVEDMVKLAEYRRTHRQLLSDAELYRIAVNGDKIIILDWELDELREDETVETIRADFERMGKRLQRIINDYDLASPQEPVKSSRTVTSREPPSLDKAWAEVLAELSPERRAIYEEKKARQS